MKELEYYINNIIKLSPLLNFGALGLLIKLILINNSTNNKMTEMKDVQIKMLEDEIQKTEKWKERKEEELINKIQELQKELNKTLEKTGGKEDAYNILKMIENHDKRLDGVLKQLIEKIEKIDIDENQYDFNMILSMASVYALESKWEKAASMYEKACSLNPGNEELYFSCGIAYANSRLGRKNDIKALQYYSNAIVYFSGNNNSFFSRLFIYKGAMLKRLNRLNEAYETVKFGYNLATEYEEINDALYNLSCISAMQDEVENFNIYSEKLKNSSKSTYNYLLQRLNKYAPKFITEIHDTSY